MKAIIIILVIGALGISGYIIGTKISSGDTRADNTLTQGETKAPVREIAEGAEDILDDVQEEDSSVDSMEEVTAQQESVYGQVISISDDELVIGTIAQRGPGTGERPQAGEHSQKREGRERIREVEITGEKVFILSDATTFYGTLDNIKVEAQGQDISRQEIGKAKVEEGEMVSVALVEGEVEAVSVTLQLIQQ